MNTADVPFDVEETEGTVAARFRKVATAMPDTPAVSDGKSTLTFAELDARTDQVAAALAGLDRARPVAIVMAHEIASIVAFIGVLKSGVTGLPVDPKAAPEGVEQALAQAQVILTELQFIDWCREKAPGVPVMTEFDAQRTEWREPEPRDAAMIYLTSATTGLAKGVVHSQRNLCRFGWQRSRDHGIVGGDRASVFSSIAHVLSGVFILGALLNGATVELFEMRGKGLSSMGLWAAARRITVLQVPTAVLRELIQVLDTSQSNWEPRQVIFGGEAIAFGDLRKVRDRLGWTCVLINMMGSAEAGIVTKWAVDLLLLDEDGVVPVGFPVAGQTITIVDDDQVELPAGDYGEIVVSGSHMALGYWQRPDLTADRFQDHAAKGRSFRTGDLGLVRPDGLLELHGRKDHLIKIRGNSLNLAYVETVLRGMDGIAETAITAVKDGGGTSRLVGYVKLESGAEGTEIDLRRRLSAALPNFMVPWKVVKLDEFPLTSGGKVARRDLPKPSRQRALWMPPFVAPKPGPESVLAEVWSEILEMDAIGRDDDFFDLGGDSMDLVSVAAGFAERQEVSLEDIDLFKESTLAGMAWVFESYLLAAQMAHRSSVRS